MLRRLDRPATKPPAAIPQQSAGEGPNVPVAAAAPGPQPATHATAAAPRTFAVTPGTYGGYATSSLQPATTLRGRIVLQRNGDFEYTGTTGVRVSGNLDFSAPDKVTGMGTVTQPKVLGVPLLRYPDGSSSTHMTIRGKMVNGKLQGQYSDPFEKGELVFDLSNPR